jgi:segregation and condensation protein A
MQAENVEKVEKKGLDLESIVSLPTWKEMLIDLVSSEKLDPWNIDVVEIAEEYIRRIKSMKLLDLHVPANLILAAAILLRFKSDALRFEEEEQVVSEEVYVGEGLPSVEIPILELRTRIPPKRKVTLEELMLTVEKVFEDQRKKEERASEIKIPPVMNIQMPEFDIEERMDGFYERIKKEKDAEGLVLFSSLLKNNSKEEIIHALLPILHLAQKGLIFIFQEKMFGEIFIRVKGGKKNGRHENN